MVYSQHHIEQKCPSSKTQGHGLQADSHFGGYFIDRGSNQNESFIK